MAPIIEPKPHTSLYSTPLTLGKRRSKSGSNLVRIDVPWGPLASLASTDSFTEMSTEHSSTRDKPFARSSSTMNVSTQPRDRASTMPPRQSTDSAKVIIANRRLSRRRSPTPSPSESSSSSGSENPTSALSVPTGIGRKVAASLQLFKDIASGSLVDDAEHYGTDTKSFEVPLLPHHIEEAHPHFEFVKRSEWPQREAARREDSSTRLLRIRAKGSTGTLGSTVDGETDHSRVRRISIRDAIEEASLEWHMRGCPQEKPISNPEANGLSSATPVSVTLASPSSNAAKRRRPLSVPNVAHHDGEADLGSPRLSESVLATPTVCQSSYVVVPSLSDRNDGVIDGMSHLRPHLISLDREQVHPRDFDRAATSPWSTDDESGWESASGTATSTSESPFPISPAATLAYPSPFSADASDDEGYYHASGRSSSHVCADVHADDDLSDSAESLHIPLKPFRNQVGGHSAIYKFTKRAVCKVGKNDKFLPFQYIDPHILYSPLCLAKTCSMSRLNVKLLRFSVIFLDISG